MDNYHQILDAEQSQRDQATFITKVYGWMTIALITTAVVALFTYTNGALRELVYSSKFVVIGLIVVELLLVGWLSMAIQKMSATTATAVFLAYSCLNGLTMSFIFMVYSASSIASTFMVTALTFGAMSVYGYFTKRDLTKMGSLLIMALIGLVIASLVNMFWANSTLYWITSFAGVLIFVGLVAWDTQKIKNMYMEGQAGSDFEKKAAIMGALALYLDFINLFIYLLRFLGKRD
jgi:hypothetical protein